MHRSVIFLLLFGLSGFTGLVYEVLWLKELSLLFGSTSDAAATTFTAFFLGLAAGGYVWGRSAAKMQRPLRVYAVLELCVALSALLYFLLLDAYHAIYFPLTQVFGNASTPWFATAVKFILALFVLFPPAFFMGGTLPVMAQYLVQHAEVFGRTVSLLYWVNTFGAALGAFVAGFYLPLWFGLTWAYIAAVGLTLLVALVAWGYSREKAGLTGAIAPPPRISDAPMLIPRHIIRGLAFLSGMVTLSLEVLWTRMFVQVLQNSVYTYTVILVTFLISLAAGSALAHGLMRTKREPRKILWGLLVGAALLVSLSPFGFVWLTDGLSYVGRGENWGAYILEVFGVAGVVMGIPGVALGSVLPFLLKLSETSAMRPGQTAGDLVALNTLGAVAGSLVAGFVLLPAFGLWSSMSLMAALYWVVLLVWPVAGSNESRLIPACGMLLLLSVFNTAQLPRVRLQPVKQQESLYEVWEGRSATVAVIKHKKAVKLKVNNYYTVGGTGAVKFEERQAHIPMLIHPQPRSAFFLGMGTGITAGAALMHEAMERVVVCELIPEVVVAAHKYFRPYVHGLFEDPRANVVVEDGRHYLMRTDERFDLIIGDLFLPWRAGVGNLYTREHMETTRTRLRNGGLFAQWLPLYQMTQDEFGVVARTMLEVFPLVTWWRGDFLAKRPIVALVGHPEATPFAPHELFQSTSIPFMAHFIGNLTAARALFQDYDVNTENWPLIEYQAPISHRRRGAKVATWFTGESLIAFMDEVAKISPPSEDPYLQSLPHSQHAMVRAGLMLHRAGVLKRVGKTVEAEDWLAQYQRLVARYTY